MKGCMTLPPPDATHAGNASARNSGRTSRQGSQPQMSPISVTLQLLELTANEIVNSIEDLKQSDRFATECYDDDHSNLGKSFQHIYASARARSKDIETLANAMEKYPIDTDDVTKKMAETARALFAVQEARNELRQKIRLLQQEKQTEFRNSYKSLVDCTIGLRGMLERSQQQHTNLQCCVDRMRDDQESLKANVREMREQLKGPRPVPMERNSLLKPAGNIEPTKNTQEAKHIIDEAWDNKTKLSASIYEDKPVEEDPPVEKLPPPPRVPPERQFNNLLKDRHLSDLAPNSKMVPSPKVFNSKLPSRKVGGSPEPSPETPTRIGRPNGPKKMLKAPTPVVKPSRTNNALLDKENRAGPFSRR